MTQPAGWYADPWGRHQQRYHDGTRWTEHVVDDGQQLVDSLGASPIVPFTHRLGTPPEQTQPVAAAGTVTASSAGDGMRRFLDSFGPDARERPAPSLHTALAGVGGAVVGAGIVGAIVGDGGSRGIAAVVGILLVAVGVLIRLFLANQVELSAAAIGAGAAGIFAIGIAVAGDDTSSAAGFLVIGLLYLAAWVLPGYRGRPLMLGLGALSLVFALASAAGDGGSNGFDADTVTSYEGTLLLFAAAVLLGLVFLLDRTGYHGVGTSLVVAALIAAAVGTASTVARLDDTGGTVLIVLAGAAVCLVGSHGKRRATTWYGAAVTAAGVVSLIVAIIEPDTSSSIGAVVIVAGLILVAAPIAITAIKAARSNPRTPPAFGPPSV
ncbi:MAG: DUF2510 domain-containing protein [Ilumatobacteraceae bacterium]